LSIDSATPISGHGCIFLIHPGALNAGAGPDASRRKRSWSRCGSFGPGNGRNTHTATGIDAWIILTTGCTRTLAENPVTTTPKVAVIEDDLPTSNQLRGWIESARPGTQVDQWFSRDEAQAAIERERYDLVVLDIELGRERHAGVALINEINKRHNTPVLVVSAMPATLYRGIMKALDAWDYLQKTTFSEADFIDTFLDILRATRDATAPPTATAVAAKTSELSLDPLRQGSALWLGQRINLPLTAQRILSALYERRGQVVSYEDLYPVVKSGRNRDNIRKHVSTIRDAFRDIDPHFEGIENVPMRGFRWAAAQAPATTSAGKR
jgi:DNA-binding response OmpR family regulator